MRIDQLRMGDDASLLIVDNISIPLLADLERIQEPGERRQIDVDGTDPCNIAVGIDNRCGYGNARVL